MKRLINSPRRITRESLQQNSGFTARVNLDRIGGSCDVRYSPDRDRTADITAGPFRADFVAKVGRSRWLICHFVKGGRL
jgi:hypothetical protein